MHLLAFPRMLLLRFWISSMVSPAGIPYEVLKDCLITTYSLNDYQRFKAWVSFPLSRDQKPSHLMNGMLALLPDDYNPDFILQGLFLSRFVPTFFRRRFQALKADELFQSRILSPVNLLADNFDDSVQVNTLSVRTRTVLSAKRSSTPAPSSPSPSSPGPCWYHKKHRDKAQNCRKHCSESEN